MVIVMFVVHSENITCHWEFSTHRAGLRLVVLNSETMKVLTRLDLGIFHF
jgi:hypothetical protein